MIWIAGIVIYLVLVVFLTAPFILSSRISRMEEVGGIYEKPVTGDEAGHQRKSDSRAAKRNRGRAFEGPLTHGKHLQLGGHS